MIIFGVVGKGETYLFLEHQTLLTKGEHQAQSPQVDM